MLNELTGLDFDRCTGVNVADTWKSGEDMEPMRSIII